VRSCVFFFLRVCSNAKSVVPPQTGFNVAAVRITHSTLSTLHPGITALKRWLLLMHPALYCIVQSCVLLVMFMSYCIRYIKDYKTVSTGIGCNRIINEITVNELVYS